MAKGSIMRGIRITPKGYAILALIDLGAYKTLTTKEARAIALRRAQRKLRKMRRHTA